MVESSYRNIIYYFGSHRLQILDPCSSFRDTCKAVSSFLLVFNYRVTYSGVFLMSFDAFIEICLCDGFSKNRYLYTIFQLLVKNRGLLCVFLCTK